MQEYLARRYALALYEISEQKNRVESILQDLREIVDIIYSNQEFQDVIKHPQISTSRKKEIFSNVFKEKVDDELLSFLILLIEKERILYIDEILIEFERIHLERNNTVVAQVKTVIPLNEDERHRLKSKLESIYNKNIIINEELDAAIIGGVYVRVGNDAIDGTIKAKLDDMKKLMLKREVR